MGPLDGVKVVDFSVMISGPLAAMMLADQGAEVVKVETPGFGDIMRLLGTSKNGMTGIFANNNRGKRSLVVDLKADGGRDVIHQLVEDADVVIQNFRPGAMARLGLGYDDLAAINPDLVYTSISGYGSSGPYSGRRVYDNVIQAASGPRQRSDRPGDRRAQRCSAHCSATSRPPTPPRRRSPLRSTLVQPARRRPAHRARHDRHGDRVPLARLGNGRGAAR